MKDTLAAGTTPKLAIALQHSPLHEIQAIEPRSMHATQNSEIQAFRCAFGARRTPMNWCLQLLLGEFSLLSLALNRITGRNTRHVLIATTVCGLQFPKRCFRASWNQVTGSFLVSGADPGGSDWGDRPPKTYESNFIHHNFVQFEKQHSRYKAILSSNVLSQQCCEVYIISLTVAKAL